MKAFLTFVCCFFTVAFSLPAQTLLEGYVRDMECRGISEAVVTVMLPDTRELIYSTQTDTAGVFVLADVPRHFLLDVVSSVISLIFVRWTQIRVRGTRYTSPWNTSRWTK